MHEFSTMCQIVNSIIEELKGKDVKVTEVWLEIGELTFLGTEQLKFAYEVLTSNDNVLKCSKLVIKKVKTLVKCNNCKYKGKIEYVDDIAFHFTAPKFCCPKCGGKIKIIAGRECIVKKIVAEKPFSLEKKSFSEEKKKKE
ncbi:MAG: hydrogenase/urease maturation nickel metallochaperone HypA [Candidatus Thermoplasmatota archaeon]|nr:hydrogenase/urease maturation nickel metallochaperone HypA [Candidatus Thermoplasmatota archaeon]